MATNKEIRAWARTQGIKVGDRGRLHPNVITKYNEAHEQGTSAEVHVVADGDEGSAEEADLYRGYDKLLEDGGGIGASPCGFCASRTCLLCPGSIRNGSGAPVKIWICPCAYKDHQ